jgi:hypothetical protein
MGFMLCTSACIACHQLFSYNPELVPSIRINAQRKPDPNGTAEPICKNCAERANPIRKQNGLELILIMPGAYEAQECI